MKFKPEYFVFMVIICILFSITAVSANDNQTDALNQDLISDNGLSISDNDELTETVKSYDDFYEDIKDCTDTFDIDGNYVYTEGDNKTYLGVKQSNLVINGNNHVIDGSGSAHAFSFSKGKQNITINDLTFVNCNQSIMLESGTLILNNVNFTGNFNSRSDAGIVTVMSKGDLILNNCTFNSNVNSSLIWQVMLR